MQRFDLEEFALRQKQFPIREEVFTMDADPCTYLDLIVGIHFTRKLLTCFDVKGRLPTCMPRM